MVNKTASANLQTNELIRYSRNSTLPHTNAAKFNGWSKGYIHVYTGDGKGKTTAALGLTLRAIGHGAKIFIGQFLKNGDYGEIKALRNFNGNVFIEQFGTGSFIGEEMSPEDYHACRCGIHIIKRVLASGDYHLVILDEINIAVCCGLLSVKELMGIVGQKPVDVELVFTGRYALPEILEVADLVTEMKEIKHYYHAGVMARLGIEK